MNHYNEEIFKERYNVDVPARWSLHQCVKTAYSKQHKNRRCVLCQWYRYSLDSATCFYCLGTANLDNFVAKEDTANEEWYQYILNDGDKENAV